MTPWAGLAADLGLLDGSQGGLGALWNGPEASGGGLGPLSGPLDAVLARSWGLWG